MKMNIIHSIYLSIVVVSLSLLSSCSSSSQSARSEAHIKHSSPDVISLYNKPYEPKPSIASKVGSSLLSGLVFAIFSSSPDSDDHFGEDRYNNRKRSRKEKRDFTRKNKQSLQNSLRNKR